MTSVRSADITLGHRDRGRGNPACDRGVQYGVWGVFGEMCAGAADADAVGRLRSPNDFEERDGGEGRAMRGGRLNAYL